MVLTVNHVNEIQSELSNENRLLCSTFRGTVYQNVQGDARLAFESVDETRPIQMKAVELAYVASVSMWFGRFLLLERAEISTRTKKTLSSHYPRDRTAKKAQNSNIEQYCDIVKSLRW